MQCLVKPYTRDTSGIAIKSTYCEVDGKPIQIFKNPKTGTGNFKKSQRGMCVVYRDANVNLNYRDGYDITTIDSFKGENLLKSVFFDGKIVKEQIFSFSYSSEDGITADATLFLAHKLPFGFHTVEIFSCLSFI